MALCRANGIDVSSKFTMSALRRQLQEMKAQDDNEEESEDSEEDVAAQPKRKIEVPHGTHRKKPYDTARIRAIQKSAVIVFIIVDSTM